MGNVQFEQHPDTRQHDDRLAYYGADERLRAVAARTYVELEPGTLVFEEYGHDAFGRRV
ncbi:hypothetical protein [Gemmatimonas sp.]|uniref:hypothetical protein n=1 Tax=Gemmatimonas sp. TaxID=1962908 RepID=UPI00286DC99C|nr:hypothetical protein [Gemmatimonas sp.]